MRTSPQRPLTLQQRLDSHGNIGATASDVSTLMRNVSTRGVSSE